MSIAKSGRSTAKSNQEPLVSIIVPVYNGSNYLKEAIDSALAQTYKNIEVLVVNDGSTDSGKTEQVANKYGTKIRYFLKKNGGVGSALNFGINKAQGQWVSWLSHDDIYFPNKIADQVSFLHENPRAKFIYSSYINSDEGDHGIHRIHTWKQNKSLPLPLQLIDSNPINGCTTLIHKECFNKADLFNEDNKTAQDWEMWINISLHYQFFFCPTLAVKRRVHNEMGSKVMSKQQRIDISETMKRADALVDKHIDLDIHISSEDKALLYLKWGDIYLKKSMHKIANEKYKKAKSLNNQIANVLWHRRILGSWHFPKYKLAKFYWNMVALKAKLLS